MSRWTVFVDRDGTLNVDQVYAVDLDRLVLRPRATDAIKLWREAGWRIVVVTNQSGIDRGKFTEADMHAYHRALQHELGGGIEAFYFCPHLPDAGCECRKPRPGMLEAAIRDLGIDRTRAFIVGDSHVDVGAGRAAGIPTVLVPAAASIEGATPDHLAPDLLAAAEWMLARARAR